MLRYFRGRSGKRRGTTALPLIMRRLAMTYTNIDEVKVFHKKLKTGSTEERMNAIAHVDKSSINFFSFFPLLLTTYNTSYLTDLTSARPLPNGHAAVLCTSISRFPFMILYLPLPFPLLTFPNYSQSVQIFY